MNLKNDSVFSKIASFLSRINYDMSSFIIFSIFIFILPLVFWPSLFAPQDFVKSTVISAGVLLSAIIYIISALKKGAQVAFPKPLTLSFLFLIVSLLISVFFSANIDRSLFGIGFEIGSASFILLCLVCVFIAAAISYRSLPRSLIIIATLCAPFPILFIYHSLRQIFGSSFLSFKILNSLTSTFIGDWYSLGNYAALVLIISLSSLVFLKWSKTQTAISWTLFSMSLVTVLIINNSRSILTSCAVFLVLGIYMIIKNRNDISKSLAGYKTAYSVVALGIVMGIFGIFGNTITGQIIEKMQLSYFEPSLNWKMTLDIAANSIKTSPIVGVGPNHFINAYLQNKPQLVNNSALWNLDFTSGFGLFPTFIVTQGLLGMLSWLTLIIVSIIFIKRTLQNLPESRESRFMIFSSLACAIFLTLLSIYTVPSHTLLVYLAVSFGLFVSAASIKSDKGDAYPDKPDSRSPFYSSTLMISLAIAVVAFVFILKNASSFVIYLKAISDYSKSQNLDAAGNGIARAMALRDLDLYMRMRSSIESTKSKNVLSTINDKSDETTVRSVTQSAVAAANNALFYANLAVHKNPNNYENHLELARASELRGLLGLADGFPTALLGYDSALKLNPYNPGIYLERARLSAYSKDVSGLLQNIKNAITLKPNYVEAYIFLSEQSEAAGNLSDAITIMQKAVEANPAAPIAYFRLGYLSFITEQYENASTALNNAISLAPKYADALYLSALTDEKLGKRNEAITKLTSLTKLYPGNDLFKSALKELAPTGDATPK